MTRLITEVSKYLMIILFACYAYECFSVLKSDGRPARIRRKFRRQACFLFLIHLDAYAVIFAKEREPGVVAFWLAQVLLLAAIRLIYNHLYGKASQLLTNNLCMLLVIGFIILTRLDGEKASRQFIFAILAVAATMLVPFIIRRVYVLRNLPYLYAFIGIAALLIVDVAGKTDYGARLSITLGPVSVQPSEFIKILFVFFIAAMFYRSVEFKQVAITTGLAALHVLILVASKDLGSAAVFFAVYLVMLYAATRNAGYLAAGTAAGAIAAFGAYKLFSHVRTRVMAWRDPLPLIEDQGYQICQSLFAIGTGGWFGMGLFQGMPDRIPVADEDFVFSAISEELGGLFAICLILVCAACYLMFLNIAMQIRDRFYRLVALGLGTAYGFQVFLAVGGAIKFIPSTGVTLPLVSYGGSSLLATFLIFAIIQGLYIIREDEAADGKGYERRRRDAGEGAPQAAERQE